MTNFDISLKGKDLIASTILRCTLIYIKQTKQWKTSIAFLSKALEYAEDAKLASAIQENLDTVILNAHLYADLSPINSAPILSTIYGAGFTLYGSTDHDLSSGSYLATYYFVFFAIPIFPLCRYRVKDTMGGYQFLGKAPLRRFDKIHLAISIGLIFLILSSLG